MTASPPPLVDVIAEALELHQQTISGDNIWGNCLCGEFVNITGIAAHQARAVLDALEKAGGVEWGVRLSDGSVEETHDQSAAQLVCLDYPSTEAVVSRITGPWTAVA